MKGHVDSLMLSSRLWRTARKHMPKPLVNMLITVRSGSTSRSPRQAEVEDHPSEAAVAAVDSEEEASAAVVAVATEAAEAAEEASVIEEAVVDPEVDHPDHQHLSDKDRSNAYEEAGRDRLPEIYEKGEDN